MYLYEENVLHIFQNNVFFFKEMGQKKEEKETKNKKELKLASFRFLFTRVENSVTYDF